MAVEMELQASYRIWGIAVPIPVCENKNPSGIAFTSFGKASVALWRPVWTCQNGIPLGLVVVLFWGESSLDPFGFSWGLECGIFKNLLLSQLQKFGKVFFDVILRDKSNLYLKNHNLHCSLNIIVVHWTVAFYSWMLMILLIYYVSFSVIRTRTLSTSHKK